jgi:hypothetical protein
MGADLGHIAGDIVPASEKQQTSLIRFTDQINRTY